MKISSTALPVILSCLMFFISLYTGSVSAQDEIFAVGDYCTILRNDGTGTDWELQLTTRPLYGVWAASENESPERTCRFIADRWFGAANGRLMSEYLQEWTAEMPSFGRETTERFLASPMTRYGGAEKTIAAPMETHAAMTSEPLMPTAGRNTKVVSSDPAMAPRVFTA